MGHRRRAARHHPAGTGGPAQAGRVSGCPRRAGVPPPSRGAPAAPRPADAGGPQRPAGDGRGAQRHRRGGVGGRLVWRPTRPPPAPRVGGGHGGAGNAPPPLGTRGRHAGGGTRRSPRPGGCRASRTALGTSASSAPCARGAKRACGKMGRGDSRRQGRPKGAGPVRCWPSAPSTRSVTAGPPRGAAGMHGARASSCETGTLAGSAASTETRPSRC